MVAIADLKIICSLKEVWWSGLDWNGFIWLKLGQWRVTMGIVMNFGFHKCGSFLGQLSD
jgi:hypothetical protein